MKNKIDIEKKINELKKDMKALKKMDGRTDDDVVPRKERNRLIKGYKYNIGALEWVLKDE